MRVRAAGRRRRGEAGSDAVEQAVEAELEPLIPWLAAGGRQLEPVQRDRRPRRQLFGSPNPSALVQAWPMQHPELAVLRWSGLLLGSSPPLAVHLYTTKSR